MTLKNEVGAMKQVKTYGIGLVLLLGVAGIPSNAQNQTQSNTQNSSTSPSLGDYARQVRKDPEAKSKPKVFDNDNLPREEHLSIVGKPAESADVAPVPKTEESQGAAAPANGTNPPTDQANKQAAWKQWGDKLESQQKQIDLLQRELDVLQREYQIRAAAMYGDAGNRLRNSADWDKQDAQYKQQIADKQKALDDAKQKQDEMQEDARKAGVPSSVREP